MTQNDPLRKIDDEVYNLSVEVSKLVKVRKKLYSNMPIESPKSPEEKKLERQIADLFSKINQLIIQKHKIRKELK